MGSKASPLEKECVCIHSWASKFHPDWTRLPLVCSLVRTACWIHVHRWHESDHTAKRHTQLSPVESFYNTLYTRHCSGFPAVCQHHASITSRSGALLGNLSHHFISTRNFRHVLFSPPLTIVCSPSSWLLWSLLLRGFPSRLKCYFEWKPSLYPHTISPFWTPMAFCPRWTCCILTFYLLLIRIPPYPCWTIQLSGVGLNLKHYIGLDLLMASTTHHALHRVMWPLNNGSKVHPCLYLQNLWILAYMARGTLSLNYLEMRLSWIIGLDLVSSQQSL